MRDVRLDWFAASVEKKDFDLGLIEKAFPWIKRKVFPGRWHLEGSKDEENGFSLFYSPKKGLKNAFAQMELSGKFFRHVDAEKKLFWLLKKMAMRPYRIDKRMDFVYYVGDEIVIPELIPLDEKAEKALNIRCDYKFTPMTYTAGRGEFKVTLYDKMREDSKWCNVQYLNERRCAPLEVWRLEVQLRGDLLRNLLEKGEYLINAPFRYLQRRYHCPQLSFEKGESGYIKKELELINQITYLEKVIKKNHQRMETLEDAWEQREKEAGRLQKYLESATGHSHQGGFVLADEEIRVEGLSTQQVDYQKEFVGSKIVHSKMKRKGKK